MSKKTKRQVRRDNSVLVAPAASSSTTPGSNNRPSEFAPDYSYISHDLRRLGTIWGSFILIFIVLSFIIR